MSCRLDTLAEEECWSPEEHFINAIIESGVAEMDVEYFTSNQFYYHCKLVGYNPDEFGPQCIAKIKAGSYRNRTYES